MKRLVLLMLLLSFKATGQQIPDMGLFKVRITESDRNITAEVKRSKSLPNIETDRIYYWFSSNKIKQTQGGYSGTLLNGQYQEYYLNKNLKAQGTFDQGLKTGTWKAWTEEGVLAESVNWKKGIRQGRYENYNDRGQLKQQGFYKNNMESGKRIIYSDQGEPTITYYKSGKLLPARKPASFWQKINIFKKKNKKTDQKPTAS